MCLFVCLPQVAVLNANYMAARLKDHYEVLFIGDGKFGIKHISNLELVQTKHRLKLEVPKAVNCLDLLVSRIA